MMARSQAADGADRKELEAIALFGEKIEPSLLAVPLKRGS